MDSAVGFNPDLCLWRLIEIVKQHLRDGRVVWRDVE